MPTLPEAAEEGYNLRSSGVLGASFGLISALGDLVWLAWTEYLMFYISHWFYLAEKGVVCDIQLCCLMLLKLDPRASRVKMCLTVIGQAS